MRDDFHALVLRQPRNAVLLLDVEGDNRRTRSRRHFDVVLRDLTDGIGDDFKAYLVALDVLKARDEGFDRSRYVALYDALVNFVVFVFDGSHQLFDTRGSGFDFRRRLQLALADCLFGNALCLAVVVDFFEVVARFGRASPAHNEGGGRGQSLLDSAAAVVHQSPDFAPVFAANDDIASLERALAHDYCRGRAPALFDLAFDNHAFDGSFRVRLKLHNFRLQQNQLEQLVDVLALERRNGGAKDFASPVFGGDAALLHLLFDAVDVRALGVHLVDRNDNRNARFLREAQRFVGLRHKAVVRRDNQDCDVGDIRAALAHFRERRVAGGVEESDFLAVAGNLIRGCVLRNAARFARDDVRVADCVQERRLAVVDVPEYADNRGARDVVFDVVFGAFYRLLFLGLLLFAPVPDVEVEAVLFGDDYRGGVFERLVHRGENPHVHKLGDEPEGLQIHRLCEVADDNRGFQLYCLKFFFALRLRGLLRSSRRGNCGSGRAAYRRRDERRGAVLRRKRRHCGRCLVKARRNERRGLAGGVFLPELDDDFRLYVRLLRGRSGFYLGHCNLRTRGSGSRGDCGSGRASNCRRNERRGAALRRKRRHGGCGCGFRHGRHNGCGFRHARRNERRGRFASRGSLFRFGRLLLFGSGGRLGLFFVRDRLFGCLGLFLRLRGFGFSQSRSGLRFGSGGFGCIGGDGGFLCGGVCARSLCRRVVLANRLGRERVDCVGGSLYLQMVYVLTPIDEVNQLLALDVELFCQCVNSYAH